MLKEIVLPRLREAFPDLETEFDGKSARIFAMIPPKHSDWTPIYLADEGHEVTVYYGAFTHWHYKIYLKDVSEEVKARDIAEILVEELGMVLNDEIEFSVEERSYGTSGPVRPENGASMSGRGVSTILWSGPWSGKRLP